EEVGVVLADDLRVLAADGLGGQADGAVRLAAQHGGAALQGVLAAGVRPLQRDQDSHDACFTACTGGMPADRSHRAEGEVVSPGGAAVAVRYRLCRPSGAETHWSGAITQGLPPLASDRCPSGAKN